MTNRVQNMLRVLFVDDEPAILSSLKRALRQDRLTLDVLTAGGPAEALRLLETENVHAVVSDLRMPEMDGTVFLQKVRDRLPMALRILLTGTPEDSGTEVAHCVLGKPCSRNDLLAALQLPAAMA